LIVHRILREVVERGRMNAPEFPIDLGERRALKRLAAPVMDEARETALRSRLENIGEHASERERAADTAERELMNWRKAEFMAERVGEVFDGIITSVKDYGFYVELNAFFVEGLVHISTLTDDAYEYQERKHRLAGGRTNRKYRLGDAVRVVVGRVDRTRHLIDFSLA